MKLWSAIFLVFSLDVAFCQWSSRVFLVDHLDYFYKVITETMKAVEERSWSTLKLNDYSNEIDEEMYKWHVTGRINYTNGFLVSIEKIDVTSVQQQMSSRTVDGVTHTLATIHGLVNLNDMKIGYDVLAQLDVEGQHTYTGTFVHTLARYQFWVMKNLNTQEITVSYMMSSLSGGLDRMVYMPANHLTEVISRSYVPSQAWDSVSTWARDVIVPTMLDVVNNKIAFPEVCLDCR